MSTVRLYAILLTLLVWAALVDVLGNSKVIVVVRLVTCAVATGVSLHETAVIGRERKRRQRRKDRKR